MLLRNNILKQAMKSIPCEKVDFQRWSGNTLIDGEDVADYENPITIKASVQAVETEMYKKLSLDFEKNYINVWANVEIKGIDKQNTPDRILYDGSIWNAITSNNWSRYDGWSNSVFVRVK